MSNVPYPSGGFNQHPSDSPSIHSIRFGQGFERTSGANSSAELEKARNLFLNEYGGMVLTSFYQKQNLFGLNPQMSVTSGKSFEFPKTGISSAEYHQEGVELTGNDFLTGSTTITADAINAANHMIYDLDQFLTHFSIREPMAHGMGQALANTSDQNKFRQLIRAAREVGTGNDDFPVGGVVGVGYGVKNTNSTSSLGRRATRDTSGGGWYNGFAYMEALRQINIDMFQNNIPMDMTKYCFVDIEVFDSIKYAYSAGTGFINLNRDYADDRAGGIMARGDHIMVDSIMVMPSINITQIKYDERSASGNVIRNAAGNVVSGGDSIGSLTEADGSTVTKTVRGNRVFPKYRNNFANTVGIVFCSGAIGTVNYKGMSFEMSRLTQRQSDFLIATQLEGHGTLRREFAYELNCTSLATEADFNEFKSYREGGAVLTSAFDTNNLVTNYTVPSSAVPHRGATA